MDCLEVDSNLGHNLDLDFGFDWDFDSDLNFGLDFDLILEPVHPPSFIFLFYSLFLPLLFVYTAFLYII